MAKININIKNQYQKSISKINFNGENQFQKSISNLKMQSSIINLKS